MFTPSSKDITGFIDILQTLNTPPNYSGLYQEPLTKTELLAFTCQIAVIMFALVSYQQKEHTAFGEYPSIRIEKLPKIAFHNAMIQYEKRDILDETYQELFVGYEELEKEFLHYRKKEVLNLTSESFYNYFSNGDNELELLTYTASLTLAYYYTYSQYSLNQKALKTLETFKNFPIIRDLLGNSCEDYEFSKLQDLFKAFLSQKNLIRWRPLRPIRKYSVLSHSFDVATLNYLLLLNSNPHNTKQAEHGFLVGLFHDIPEIWTGDIPSPLKKIVPNLNERVEALEALKVESEALSKLPTWLIPQFKQLMLEFLPEEEKESYKIGDSIDGYIEASKLLEAKSTHSYFEKIVLSGVIQAKRSSITETNIMNKLCKDAHIPALKVFFAKTKHWFSTIFS